MKQNYGIVGSRTFADETCYAFLKECLTKFDIGTIVSGGAKGVDTLAENYADEMGLPKLIFLPDWKKNGKAAGMIRNKTIVDNSDVIVAFWDGKSKGTKHTINLAKKQGKIVHILSMLKSELN